MPCHFCPLSIDDRLVIPARCSNSQCNHCLCTCIEDGSTSTSIRKFDLEKQNSNCPENMLSTYLYSCSISWRRVTFRCCRLHMYIVLMCVSFGEFDSVINAHRCRYLYMSLLIVWLTRLHETISVTILTSIFLVVTSKFSRLDTTSKLKDNLKEFSSRRNLEVTTKNTSNSPKWAINTYNHHTGQAAY